MINRKWYYKIAQVSKKLYVIQKVIDICASEQLYTKDKAVAIAWRLNAGAENFDDIQVEVDKIKANEREISS